MSDAKFPVKSALGDRMAGGFNKKDSELLQLANVFNGNSRTVASKVGLVSGRSDSTVVSQNSELDMPPSTNTWSVPLKSSQREMAVEVALFAIAIGESFGSAFEGLPRASAKRKAARIYKSKGLHALPRHHGLMTMFSLSIGQAMLGSRSNPAEYGRRLKNRVWGYSFVMAGQFAAEAIFPGPFARPKSLRCRKLSRIDRAFPGIVFLASTVQGATNKITPWIEGTLIAAGAIDDSQLDFGRFLARATQLAIFVDGNHWDDRTSLEWLAEGGLGPKVDPWLEMMSESLQHKESYADFCQSVLAKVPDLKTLDDPRAVICTAIYAWMRYRDDWLDGLHRISAQGGMTSARCAIFSALTGLLSNAECLPPSVIQRHRWSPVTPFWLDALFHRLLNWPHGADDLVRAHGLSTPWLGSWFAQTGLVLRAFGQASRRAVCSIFVRSR